MSRRSDVRRDARRAAFAGADGDDADRWNPYAPGGGREDTWFAEFHRQTWREAFLAEAARLTECETHPPAEVDDSVYLLDLRERLRGVPVGYGTDDGDIDRLGEIAQKLRDMRE
jgi:hypothetical protein